MPQDILVMAPELQEDLIGTKDEIGSSIIHLNNSKLHLSLVPQEISWSMAPELQEDLIGTKDEIGSSIIHLNNSQATPRSGATGKYPGHGTRIARGLVWYKGDQHESMLIKFTYRYSSHWCHKS